MKKTIALFSLFFVSNFSFAQSLPKLIKANFNIERNSGGSVRILKSTPIDQFAGTSKDKCLSYAAKQYNSLMSKNDHHLQMIQNSIGAKLKQLESTCRYFRFELIEAVTDQGSISTSNKQFTYRCYETSDIKLSDARVIQIKPHVISSMNLKDSPTDDEENSKLIKSKCDIFNIAQSLEKNLAITARTKAAPTSKKVQSNQ